MLIYFFKMLYYTFANSLEGIFQNFIFWMYFKKLKDFIGAEN